jgi:hypothetical protein
MRHGLLLVTIALGLAACEPTMIVLRNPATGQVAECTTGLPQVIDVLGENQACADAYSQQGFQQQVP